MDNRNTRGDKHGEDVIKKDTDDGKHAKSRDRDQQGESSPEMVCSVACATAAAYPTKAMDVVNEVERIEEAVLVIAKCIRTILSSSSVADPRLLLGHLLTDSAQPSKKTKTSSAPTQPRSVQHIPSRLSDTNPKYHKDDKDLQRIKEFYLQSINHISGR